MNVLITGANSGIGFEAAKRLLQLGHVVYIACRSTSKTSEALQQLSPFGQVKKAADVLELEDLESVKDFAENLKVDSLDCLINNAGVMKIPEKEMTKQGIEKHVGVNFVAPYLLSRLLAGKLENASKASGQPSRIVNVSGDAYLHVKEIDIAQILEGVESYNQDNQYWASKLLQIWDTAEMNYRYASQSSNPSLISFALHPGIIRTNLGRRLTSEKYTELLKPYKLTKKEDGANTTVFCATASLAELKCSPPLKDYASQVQYYRNSARAMRMTPLVANNPGKIEEMKQAIAPYMTPFL